MSHGLRAGEEHDRRPMAMSLGDRKTGKDNKETRHTYPIGGRRKTGETDQVKGK